MLGSIKRAVGMDEQSESESAPAEGEIPRPVFEVPTKPEAVEEEDDIPMPASSAPPPPSPYGTRRNRRILLAVAAVWGLVLATTGIWYSLHGRHTAREQTTIAQAQSTVDQALTAVVRAAGASPVPAVFGFDKVSDCKVTPIRSGAKYERVLWLYVPVAAEPALLDRIAAGLPAKYRAQAHHSPGNALHTLTADAGDFVAVNGSVPGPGLVSVKAETGCRTLGRLPATDPTTAAGTDPLGVTGDWRLHSLPCGLRTATVAGPATRPLSGLPRAGAVVATDTVYADHTGLGAHRDAETVTLTMTTGTCTG